jgi:hypothetical protein
MINLKATLSVRLPSGRFPRQSLVKVLAEARQRVAADVEGAFAGRKDPQTGKPWPRRKKGQTWPPLRKTGKLKREGVRAAQQARITGSTLVVRQTEPDYATYHHTGTSLMPRRRSLAISPATRKFVARRLAGEGLRVFRGTG